MIMDPILLSQERLASWMRDLGYSNYEELTNIQIAQVCNTPARRQFVDVITSELTDRRRLRKDKGDNAKEKSLLELIHPIQRQNASLSLEIDKIEKRARERVTKVGKIDRITRELETKRLIFRRMSNKSKQVLLKYQEMGRTVEDRCNDEPSNEGNEHLKEWLLKTREIAQREADSIIMCTGSRFTSGGNAHFHFLRNKQQSLNLSSPSHPSDIHQHERNIPLDTHWSKLLAKEMTGWMLVNSLRVLMNGQRLRPAANLKATPTFSDINVAADSLFDARKPEVNHLSTTHEELESMRCTVLTSSSKKKGNKREYVERLREKQIEWLERLKNETDATKGIIAELAAKVRTDALQWQKIVRRRTHFTTRHGQCLMRIPLLKLRLRQPELLLSDGQKQDPEKQHLVASTVASLSKSIMFEIHSTVLEMTERREIDLETRKEKILQRQLQNLLERLLQSQNRMECVGEISKISQNDRLDEMLPASHTVNGMTYSEWMYQFSLRGNSTVGPAISPYSYFCE